MNKYFGPWEYLKGHFKNSQKNTEIDPLLGDRVKNLHQDAVLERGNLTVTHRQYNYKTEHTRNNIPVWNILDHINQNFWHVLFFSFVGLYRCIARIRSIRATIKLFLCKIVWKCTNVVIFLRSVFLAFGQGKKKRKVKVGKNREVHAPTCWIPLLTAFLGQDWVKSSAGLCLASSVT